MTRELALLERIVALARARHVRLEDFAHTLAASPELAADVVRVAGSALYGMEGRIHGLQRAVLILGVETVTEIAAAVLAQREFGAARTAWHHGLQIGACGQLIARRLDLRLETEVWVTGLFHELRSLELAREAPVAALVQAAHAVALGGDGLPDPLADLGLYPDDVAELRALLDERVKQLAAVL
jgi:HD-like signal output (HDOD) protein